MEIKKYAVIVAGGSGSRMGAAIPKQFLLLHHKPLLYYSIKSFLEAYEDIEIILAVPVDYISLAVEIKNKDFQKAKIQIITGGETRFHSVKNGLALIKDESIIFVHDAVRCLVTPGLIRRCFDKALESGTAIPAICSKDSVRLQTETGIKTYDRNKVMLIQTPQTFQSRILLPAYQVDYKEAFTDEATVVEASGTVISIIEGEENNFKITKPVDLFLAEKLLST